MTWLKSRTANPQASAPLPRPSCRPPSAGSSRLPAGPDRRALLGGAVPRRSPPIAGVAGAAGSGARTSRSRARMPLQRRLLAGLDRQRRALRIAAAHRSATGQGCLGRGLLVDQADAVRLAAPMSAPVRSRPIATFQGTRRVRRWMPPPSAIRPRRGSGRPNWACSATIMSQPAPAPAAADGVAVDGGDDRLPAAELRRREARSIAARGAPHGLLMLGAPLQVRPAQKARSPAPVRIGDQGPGRRGSAHRGGQRGAQDGGIDRVERLGPVERDVGDPAAALGPHVLERRRGHETAPAARRAAW